MTERPVPLKDKSNVRVLLEMKVTAHHRGHRRKNSCQLEQKGAREGIGYSLCWGFCK